MNHKKQNRFLYSNNNYMQHEEASLVQYEALDYEIKQNETKDYIFKNMLL